MQSFLYYLLGITMYLNVYSIRLSTAYSHPTMSSYPQLWITVENSKISFIHRIFL